MRTIKYLLLASLIAMFATPALAVEIGGFVDIALFDIEGDGTNGGVSMVGADPCTNRAWQTDLDAANLATGNTTWAVSWVRINVTEDLTDNISVTVHLDSVNSGALGVGKAYVDFVNPGPADVTLRVGEHLSILGLEPRTCGPAGRDAISMTMLSNWTTGTATGAAILGSFAPLNYAFAVNNAAYGILEDTAGFTAANGFQGGKEGNNPNGNNQMTFAGNIGVVPIEGLEIGVYGEFGANANGLEADGANVGPNPSGVSGNDSDHELWGVYGEYAYGPFKVNGEYIRDEEELSTEWTGVDENEVEAWYIYGSYDVTSELTLWARYGEVEYEGETANKANQRPADFYSNEMCCDQERFAFGASYDIADNVTVKAEYQDNDEEDRELSATGVIPQLVNADRDNDLIAGSLVVSF